jgi:hypothetical protein
MLLEKNSISDSSREDVQLSKRLYNWSIGKNAEMFYKFFTYLYEQNKKEGFHYLEKDLLFAIDAIRLKEINGEEILKQKAKVVIGMYLDSVIPPKSQINVNHDMSNKLLKAAHNITQGSYSKFDLAVFEEAKCLLLKELLPFWGIIYNLIFFYFLKKKI